MLSIIICSRKLSDFQKVQQNIADTVGLPFEVIRMDNSANAYSISRAYNEGAMKSRYPFLCFVHEDVAFLTPNWGTLLVKHLENHEIGLVGVAGGVVKTRATGPAWWSPMENSGRVHIVQFRANGSKETLLRNPLQEQQSEVVALDGVFLACRKETWQISPFDERAVKGFHFYDLDFSLSVGIHKKVVVVYDILLEHFSEGKNDRTWAEQADYVGKKWKKHLPKATITLSSDEMDQIEKQTQDFYLHTLFKQGCSFSLKVKYVILRMLQRPSDWSGNLYFLKKLA